MVYKVGDVVRLDCAFGVSAVITRVVNVNGGRVYYVEDLVNRMGAFHAEGCFGVEANPAIKKVVEKNENPFTKKD